MRAMIVTTAEGEKRRLNPMQIIGWKEGDIPAPGGKVRLGTLIALPGDQLVGVRETEEQIDMLFQEATAIEPAAQDYGIRPVRPVIVEEQRS